MCVREECTGHSECVCERTGDRERELSGRSRRKRNETARKPWDLKALASATTPEERSRARG